MTKNTKIVATIGPASESEEILEQMMAAGMNIARFNTKHSDPDWHNNHIQRVRKVSEKVKIPVGVLLDLQGPEIRINLPDQKSFKVKKNDLVKFSSDTNDKDKKLVFVPQNVIESLNEGNQILLEDGACEFTVVEKSGNYFMARAEIDCDVNHRKTLNTPGVTLDMPSLTDRDYKYLDGVKPDLIDYVGLSFVRDAGDIAVLREEMKKRNITAEIVAKIENMEALNNIDEIIDASEAVMIARGDLGVEVPFQELIYWQKKIIYKCRLKAKPVITATEMLKSMVKNPRPTRAEVSDVANAIYDGTDAVMLSDETTIGEYPVKAVQAQASIAEFNEEHSSKLLKKTLSIREHLTSAMSHTVADLLQNSNYSIDKVICLTETGKTARLISRFRNNTPTKAITSSSKVVRRLALSYGIEPYMVILPEKKITPDEVVEKCKKRGIAKTGEVVLLIHGTFWKHPGLTNTMSIITIT